MEHFLSTLPYPNKDHAIHGPDPLLIGRDEHILGKSLPPEKRRGKSTGAD